MYYESQIVVKQRFAISDVAIHELTPLGRDLGELRAEAGLAIAATRVGRVARPAYDAERFELIASGHRHAQRERLTNGRDLVGGNEDAARVDHVIAAQALVEIRAAVCAKLGLHAH